MSVKGGCLLSIMGGVCCKPSAIEDSKESPRERMSTKSASLDSCVPRGASLRREDAYRVKDRYFVKLPYFGQLLNDECTHV